MIEEELTGETIKVFCKVYNTLGNGFIERVYQNALILELSTSGMKVETEHSIAVNYCEGYRDVCGRYCC